MNNTMFIAHSLIFYPGYFEDNCQELSDEIIIPSYHLNKLMEQFDDGEMLYVNLTNTETNQSCLVAIGSPHAYDKNTIFAPQWILDLISCTGNCDSVITIEKADMDDIPVCTKISIKPLDPIAFELDTLACFEKALMNLHSIKQGITIPVQVPQLGKDYMMFAHIEKVEPADVSRIVHGEVDVEFINEFNTDLVPTAPDNSLNNSPLFAPMISSSTNTIISPTFTSLLNTPVPSTMIQEVSQEERRRCVRESWLKRFENNVTRQ
jgi:hypothetical protein